MPTRILVVDSDQVTIHWLQSKLATEGYTVDGATRGDIALQKIAQDPPDLIILDLSLPDGNGLDLIHRLREDPKFRNLGIIIFSLRAEPNDIVAGLNAGADHYVHKRPGADAELLPVVRACLTHPPKITYAASHGKIISFCSAKGGTGTTSVCVNTAYALAKLEPQARIVVIDMVFPIGSVASSLGYETARTIARMSREVTSQVDRVTIERYVSQKLKWGFYVIIGANDPQEATGLNVDQISTIFEMLSATYDYILVDLGRTLSRISIPIIENAAAVVVIVTPDASTVKASRVMLDYLEAHNVERNRLILINNRTVGRVWTTTEDIERELRLPLSLTIPYVVEYMTMAINASVPFMEKFPDHAAGMVFTDLARMLQARERAKT
ncbi:MAG: response regulator [Chloroflexota bacterium]